MATDRQLHPRPLVPLSQETLSELNLHVLLDPDDADEVAGVAEMHHYIRHVLAQYPRWEVFLDRARPANQLAGVIRFRKLLNELIKNHGELDERTWLDIDVAYDRSTFPILHRSRSESRVRGALDKIAAAVSEVGNLLEWIRFYEPNDQHPPTTEARQLLIAALVRIFDAYAPKTPSDQTSERTERLRFVGKILRSAGVPCPAHDDNLRELVDREQPWVDVFPDGFSPWERTTPASR